MGVSEEEGHVSQCGDLTPLICFAASYIPLPLSHANICLPHPPGSCYSMQHDRRCCLKPPSRSIRTSMMFAAVSRPLGMVQGIEHGWKLPQPCSVDPQHVPGSERLPKSLAEAIHAFEHPPEGSPGAPVKEQSPAGMMQRLCHCMLRASKPP